MISREEVLTKTMGGLSIFRHYIRGDWKIREKFLNPLYKDTNKSCNIYYDKESNRYRMKDFGEDYYSGDCFDIVGLIYNLDSDSEFHLILQRINEDLSLGLSHNPQIEPRASPTKSTPSSAKAAIEQEHIVNMETLARQKAAPYTIETKPFTASELAFWQQWGVDLGVLERFNVASIVAFGSIGKDGKPYRIASKSSSPMFGYQGAGYTKIYSPFDSKYRFSYVGEKSEVYCFGLEQLPTKGDVLYITGGEKDVLSLSARGFNAICFNSESAEIPAETIKMLSFMFKYIVLLFDMDKAGLKYSQLRQEQFADYGVLRLLLPLPGSKEAKDISDYFKLGNSVSDFRELLLELLEPFYSNTLLVLKSCEVNLSKKIPKSLSIVSAGGVSLATQGNLFCISGGEGTGKSNFIGSLIAGCLNVSHAEVDTLGFDVAPNTQRRAILLYDTEQSVAQLYKNSHNILRRCNLKEKPSYFKAYSLTSMSRKERLQSIKDSMDRFHHQRGGIHLVVIDGVADLVRSANDESESVAVVEELYRLAGMYNTCIVCVLHFVPNGAKLRGHLGSELQRKAAAIISIERDSAHAISVVKTLKVRDGSALDVPQIQFGWNSEIAMHSYIGVKPRQDKQLQREQELITAAKNIFEERVSITYGELCLELQRELDIKERAAKNSIRLMKEKEIIVCDPSDASYYIIGNVN